MNWRGPAMPLTILLVGVRLSAETILLDGPRVTVDKDRELYE